MSHAAGTVTFSDQTVFHFEYNGTVDICVPPIYKTYDEMQENWRKSNWKTCNCGRDEIVTIFTEYGWGFSWMGRACKYCMCITAGLEPNEIES